MTQPVSQRSQEHITFLHARDRQHRCTCQLLQNSTQMLMAIQHQQAVHTQVLSVFELQSMGTADEVLQV